MSPAGRRPPVPVRRPAAPRPQRDADRQVRLPETGPAAGPGADRREPGPAGREGLTAAPAGVRPDPDRPTHPDHPDRPDHLDRSDRPEPRAPGRPPVRDGRAGRASSEGAPPQRDPQARRRLVLRVLGVAVLVAAVVGAAVWALLFSSLTALRDVAVTGADRTGAPAVQQTAADQLGLPLLRVDTGAVASRVERLPWVASVQVHRGFAHRLDVTVVEKVPVAAVPAPDGAPGVVLLDGDGATITTADAAPEGVPVVQVDPARADAVRAASAVALALPASLREQVSAVTATGPDDVRLALRDGKEVVWGGPGDDDLKARVAALLLPRDGVRRVDVSAPLAPATSP